MDIDFNKIISEKLLEIHNFNYFDCNDEDINDFIKNDALKWQKQKIATTILFMQEGEIMGFFSVSSDAIKLKLDEKEQYNNLRILAEYPAVKIGRLGVHKKYQNKGLGKYILRLAIGYILKYSENIATRFVTVDSYANKVGWYKRIGFKSNKHDKYIKKTDYVSMRYDLYNPENENNN